MCGIMRGMKQRVVSEFSREFSRHLSDILRESPASLRQSDIADRLPGSRSQGYVSERLGGKRPVDTDMIDVIADMLGYSPSWLVGQILGRMDRHLIDPRSGINI